MYVCMYVCMQFAVTRIFFSFSNDIGNPCSCTPLIPLSVTFEPLSNLMTFLCRLKYRYVLQAKRSAALKGLHVAWRKGGCTRLEDFSPSKICQPYEQLCSTRLHQTIYTSSLYQPASSPNSSQKKGKSVFFSRSSRTARTCRV